MKHFLSLVLSISSAFLFGDDSATIFSKDRLVQFYDEFLLEEKLYLSEAGVGSYGGVYDPFTPPPNPAAPPFKSGYLPMALVNQSGYPDSQVYVLVTGDLTDGATQAWGQVDTSPGSNFGVASLVVAATGQNATQFSCTLSQLPSYNAGNGNTGRVLYLPQITSGLVWFSIGEALSMTVNGNSIVHPSYTTTTTNFDTFEMTYLLSGDPQVSVDTTAVSAFSIPLYAYLSGATSVSANSGVYQPRSYIMEQLESAFASATESSQWSNLVLKNGSTVLRCLSPGQAISASLFDENYLNNSASYGYSYLSNLLTYYNTHALSMTVGVTVPSTATYNYTGSATGNIFSFTSTNGGPSVTFEAFANGPPYTSSTTYNILEGLNLVNPITQPTAGTAADAVSKLFEEAIVAGILPTTNTVVLSSLVANQSSYYKVNANLSSPGGTTGPWYDLYSKVLHEFGYIYTYAYDDALWPQVLLGAPFTNNSTYVGITIRNSQ